MKRIVILIAAVLVSVVSMSQTLNVEVGNVTYQIPAAQAGDMVYSNGTSVEIMGKTFALSEVKSMYVDQTAVTDNTVSVSYNGTSAAVTVAGNIAKNLTITTRNAHVSIVQDDNVTDEITYTLSGTSSDGSFYMDGNLKASFVLNGLTLNNPDSAAINIRDGKRISVELADGTTNTLTDGTGGKQKACFAVKGHTEFKGGGTLNITGNTAHAFWGKEYVQLKKTVGTINILGAVGDGFNVNQFFQQNGGAVTIKNVGDDGIQLSFETDDNDQIISTEDDEDNTGEVIIKGGTLNISVTAKAAKCIKSEGAVIVNDGALTLKASGAIDLSDTSDPSYTAGIKAQSFTQNGGTISVTITGTAGRGVSADETITTNGGTLTITNSGAGQKGSSDNYTAKGLKALNIALNAGTITINMSGTGGKGIRAGSGNKSSSFGKTTYTNVKGSYTQGFSDGTGPTLTVNTSGSSLGSSGSSGGGGGPGGWGGWGPGGGGGMGQSSGSDSKAIKVICAATLYGGETTVNTQKSGAEGLESKTSIDVRGGKHYFQCYDDCMNSSGKIIFNGGITVCYSTGNDAIDSNLGSSGAITIGDGVVFAYMTKGDPDEGFDCDNNNYIQITGTGIGISAGGKQSSTSGTVSNAKQGYAFLTKPSSYAANTYYTLTDASGNNLVTYSFAAKVTNNLSLVTAKGMTKNGSYTIWSSTTAPTDATTVFHGLYLGSSTVGSTNVCSFTAK